MTLEEILRAKGTTVYQIGPQATLAEAVAELIRHNVGSLVVCESEGEHVRPVGIVTERDVLRQCASKQVDLTAVRVADVMSTDLITATPEDAIEQIMGVMTQRRIRHLPVCVQGRLAGLVSIGDVVKAQHDQLAFENRFMKDYIRG